MGGLRKTASKIHRGAMKTADPIGHAVMGDKHPERKLADEIEGFTAENVWGGPIDPKNPNQPLPKVNEMPDEEQIKKSNRRNQSRKRAASGRASTVLSDGLGG